MFYQGDLTFGELVNLMVGARLDDYDLSSNDTGHLSIDDPAQSASDDDFTWNASLSLLLDNGLVPYITYAESSAIENSQAGDVSPSLVSNGQWLSESDLKEVGLKFDLFDQTLVGGVSYYDQNRTRLSTRDRVVATTSKGTELELRWLVDDNVSATLTATDQETTIEGPETGFIYVPAYAVGLTPAQASGGSLAVFSFASSPIGFPGDYTATNIPENTVSLYGTYVSDPLSWGQAGASLGITHVSETATLLSGPVIYPSYEVVNLSLFATLDKTQLSLNINNLLDEEYFQPAAGSYVNTSALPGRAREWRITLKQTF
ncbi:TonB-dependent receptor domain-containing protein [Kineobactrum salinum]|uniref:TonB-dependent receptor domain-containing protein n=1 Tax=Kineobactrum salinum TaxID=2708301 RepID=UPI0022B2A936|nr:TonB-dependent receptor [Kineobactrum salinum]